MSATTTKGMLVINRIFNASRGQVWKAWTDPEQLGKWSGPKGYTSPVNRIDLRPGGKYLSSMRSPDGKIIWGTGVYREIVPEERIVCTDSFADENGNIVPASHYGMEGDWPRELLVTVTFEDLGKRTGLILRHEGIPEDQKAAAEAGWNESFDKLADLLAGEGIRRAA